MDSKGRILVVIDPTAELDQPCVRRAALLGQATGVGLELLICFYDQALSGERFFDSAGLARSRRDAIHNRRVFLDKIAQPLRDSGQDVIVTALWDTPLDDAILRHVLSTSPMMVVKDTHYHKAISRALFTNTDWNLIRKCPVPLWLVKPRNWGEMPVILAAVDPLHCHDKPAILDKTILDAAKTFADAVQGTLHVFHSYPVLSHRLATNPELLSDSLTKIDHDIEVEHQAALNDLLQGYGVENSQIHLMSGEPSQLLPSVSSTLDTAVVVMGAIARNPIERVFLGNTAEKVMDTVTADLLIVKPEWITGKIKAKDIEICEGDRVVNG